MPAARRYDLVIVGLGSAGMVAAEFAAQLGLRVAAIERDRVGGDCLWTGCVPSKALLAAAKTAHTMRNAGDFGIEPVEPRIDTSRVWQRIRAVQDVLAGRDDDPARFAELGVDLIFGAARVSGPTTIAVEGAGEIEARRILLCTGSRPAVPELPGLAEAGFLSSETLWQLERAPQSLIVIGAGPIGVELAQALARLGVSITLLQRGPSILPRDEPALAGMLLEQLRADGVRVELNVAAERVTIEAGLKVVHARGGRSWRAAELLLAAGRRPNVEGLGLEQLGIDVTSAGVKTDAGLRTQVRSIYAAGDLAGGHLFTHSAGFEAGRALRNMFYPGRNRSPFLVPWTTFTDPELAHVGLSAGAARAEHGDGVVREWRHDLAHSDRAVAEGAERGALIIVTARGRIVGAQALAPAAGELIHELALAIHRRMKLKQLASMVHVYPTIATAVQQLAARAAYEDARRYRLLLR
ncbi:MAG: FAD-dependent oxidoreductase [Solirubrobacteraceae bacterium]